jgi:hypothetical protein
MISWDTPTKGFPEMPSNPSAHTKIDSSCRLEQGIPAPKQKVAEAGPSSDTVIAKGGTLLPRGSKTICIPCDPERYPELVKSKACFRRHVDGLYAQYPELFPQAMGEGYRCHDIRAPSVKLGIRLRRIQLVATEEVFSICPSFVMPYMTGMTSEVAHALFLLGFGVPFWALTHVFGRNDMYWYRLATAFGRNSITGTTVKHPEDLPKDLLADEKHTKHGGEKVYVATTVGNDCMLGAAMCKGADAVALTQGYGAFAKEARNLDPDYQAETVNTDGWGATQNAWVALFAQIVIIQCFLHAFIKVRERCKKWGELFTEISTGVWNAYHAPNKRAFSQRIRRLREWAQETLDEGVVLNKLLALCEKAPLFAQAYDHPNSHRTSNMVDRLMRWQDRFLFNRQYFHRSWEAAELGIRAWAILCNFRPYCPRAIGKRTDGNCAAERLNGFRYCDNWLENLRVSTSMGGYRQ